MESKKAAVTLSSRLNRLQRMLPEAVPAEPAEAQPALFGGPCMLTVSNHRASALRLVWRYQSKCASLARRSETSLMFTGTGRIFPLRYLQQLCRSAGGFATQGGDNTVRCSNPELFVRRQITNNEGESWSCVLYRLREEGGKTTHKSRMGNHTGPVSAAVGLFSTTPSYSAASCSCVPSISSTRSPVCLATISSAAHPQPPDDNASLMLKISAFRPAVVGVMSVLHGQKLFLGGAAVSKSR